MVDTRPVAHDFLITAHYRQELARVIAAHACECHPGQIMDRDSLMVKIDQVLDEWLVAERR